MQLRDEPVEAGGDGAPIAKPGAREAKCDLGRFEHPFLNAGAGHRIAGTRAKSEKLLGIASDIDQIFARIGRAGAERQNGKPVRSRARVGFDIARIDGAQPIERRQLGAEPVNGDEQPFVLGFGGRRRGILRA